MNRVKFINLEDYRRLDEVIMKLSKSHTQVICVFESSTVRDLIMTRQWFAMMLR